jgi:predicted metal-dependent peptidase
MEPREKVTAWKIASRLILPYLAARVYGMPTYERKGLGTAAVDARGNLYFDPAFADRISTPAGAFVILHEVLHVVLGHARIARRVLGEKPTAENARLWNVACDYVVNGILKKWISDAPSGVMVAEDDGFPPNLSATEYYELLRQQPNDEEQSDDDQSESDEDGDDDSEQDESDDAGDGNEDGDGDGVPAESEEESSEDDDGDGDADSQPGEGDDEDDAEGEGSSAGGDDDAEDGDGGKGGPAAEGGDSTDDGGNAADVDPPGGSSADGIPRSWEEPDSGTDDEREWAADKDLAEKIKEIEAGSPGSVPSQLVEALDLRFTRQVDPFDLLLSRICRAVASPVGRPDFTLRRLSRRQQEDGPRLRGVVKQTPSAVVVLDTSGSMQLGYESELRDRALGVIEKGVKRLGQVTVVQGDTRVHSRDVVRSAKAMKVGHGGGTDMGVVLEACERELKPDCMILITDGITPYPARRLKSRVIVALVRQRDGAYPIPSWMQVCELAKKGG